MIRYSRNSTGLAIEVSSLASMGSGSRVDVMSRDGVGLGSEQTYVRFLASRMFSASCVEYVHGLVVTHIFSSIQLDSFKQTEHSIRPASSGSRLGHIGLYARRPVRCVPLTTTHCRLRLTWSREHALWTPQQWSHVMLSDESRFSLQSDSRRTLIWRAPGTRYHQETPIEGHRYDGAGWLVWGGIILGSRTELHVQS
ncbi:HTH_Tnp_Tc3_2 domain-containing protein [Trichonephila clavipes]|nr:HTH_Tnp_Tc3_2 domain-containing protein [Trichonephila clavipes]